MSTVRGAISVVVLALCSSLPYAAGTNQSPTSGVPATQAIPAANLRVLFIGNSLTYLNDLPNLTAALAASARPPRKLETEFVGEGGATLKRHWEAGRALEAIRKGKWDYVVLQEQGGLAMRDSKMFHDYTRLFDAEIKKAGAKTVLFQPWGSPNAPQEAALLANAFASIGRELKAIVAPVGLAWHASLQENPKIILHWSDGGHPIAAGSYLTACVFYAVLFSSSPEGLSHGNVSKADAVFLQRIAWKTAQEHQYAVAAGKALPADFKIPEARPAAAAGPATTEALERGRAVLAAAQKAAGGLERLRGLYDVTVSLTGKIVGPQGEVPITTRETWVFPSVLRNEVQFPSGSVVNFFDGANGWRKLPEGVRDFSEPVKQAWRAEIIRNTLNLLRAEGEFSVEYEKREKAGDLEADIVVIRKQGEIVRLGFAPASGMLLTKSYRGIGLGGPADFEQTYSDYRDVSGFMVPFRVTITQNGSPYLEGTVSGVKFNTGVDPVELGKKPQ